MRGPGAARGPVPARSSGVNSVSPGGGCARPGPSEGRATGALLREEPPSAREHTSPVRRPEGGCAASETRYSAPEVNVLRALAGAASACAMAVVLVACKSGDRTAPAPGDRSPRTAPTLD